MASVALNLREHDKKILRFFCALARQCFINEFVFVCSRSGTGAGAAVAWSSSPVRSKSGAPVPELWLGSLCCLLPPRFSSLRRNCWRGDVGPNAVTQLLTLQCRRWSRSGNCAPPCHVLPPSVKERRARLGKQYEENPYPRWIKASPVGQPTTISARLREQFPHLDRRTLPTPRPTEILIAGCGTGQHSIETARQFKTSAAAGRRSQSDKSYAMRCEKRESLV